MICYDYLMNSKDKTHGLLTLVPTPISEDLPLEEVAFKRLYNAATLEREKSIFVIEDLKPGRKRWLSFKLPREIVEDFVLYNEHTSKTVSLDLLQQLKNGMNVYLMSDGGLPAFYDPGIELVDLCHLNNIKVTSTPFNNSVSLALALSGFSHKKFWFEGFLPMDSEERHKTIKSLYSQKHTSIVMDTPYRLKRVLEEFAEIHGQSRKNVFLALDLNSQTEELRRGKPLELLKSITDLRREFVLVLSE